MTPASSLESLLGDSMESVYREAGRLEEQGKFLQAFHLFLRVAEASPPPLAARALNNAAVILSDHGFEEDAREMLRLSLRQDGQCAEARENLACLGDGPS